MTAGLFATHTNGAAQVAAAYGGRSVWVIVAVLVAACVVTLRRRDGATAPGELLTQAAGLQIRGFAVLLLLVGHLCEKVVDGYQPLERAGNWAVVVFLLVSGVALAKTYGFGPIDGRRFALQRARRLLAPFWVTLAAFYLLDYLLLGRTHAVAKRILPSFAGIVLPAPPNGPAWFITYIVFLYTVFFLLARLRLPTRGKLALLFVAPAAVAAGLHAVPYVEEKFGIWSQYAPVFPLAVAFGLQRARFLAWASGRWTAGRAVALLAAMAGTAFYWSDFAKGDLRGTQIGPLAGMALDWLGSGSFAAALALLLPRIDAARRGSALLAFLGAYSFEIYLVHFPFMVYYDFLLFRHPLPLFFLGYVAGVAGLAVGLQRLSRRLNALAALST